MNSLRPRGRSHPSARPSSRPRCWHPRAPRQRRQRLRRRTPSCRRSPAATTSPATTSHQCRASLSRSRLPRTASQNAGVAAGGRRSLHLLERVAVQHAAVQRQQLAHVEAGRRARNARQVEAGPAPRAAAFPASRWCPAAPGRRRWRRAPSRPARKRAATARPAAWTACRHRHRPAAAGARNVSLRGLLPSATDVDLHAGVGDVVLAADDVADLAVDVIDHAGEGVERGAVRADQHRIRHRWQLDAAPAEHAVGPLDGRIGQLEAPVRRLAVRLGLRALLRRSASAWRGRRPAPGRA